MGSRFAIGILVVVGSLALLLLSGKLTADASRPWQFGSLIAVMAIYSSLLWLRDRYFPAKERVRHEGSQNPLIQEVRSPWTLLTATFVLIGLPFMFIMRSEGALEPSEATRLAFKITAWGVLAPALALMIARVPNHKPTQLFDWWLPGGLLLVLSMFAAKFSPGMVLLIKDQANADLPNVATLLMAPVAAFLWRTFAATRQVGGD